MNVPVRLTGFALGLVAVFGAAAGLGSAVGPVGPTSAPAADAGHGGADAHDGEKAAPVADAEVPAGLMVSEDGYTLDLAAGTVPAGDATALTFRVVGPDGHAVRAYEESHEQDIHLIAVRRDLSGFQHVHPTLGADGVWTTPLALIPGSWRVFADFVPSADGENRILGADLSVAGGFMPTPLPAASRTSEVAGYTVTLDGELTAGTESELTLSVRRDGRPVTDLQPYLGAYGHLVALRSGDLAYLHVHPADDGDAGPDVRFFTTAPSAGTYRLFLDFKHGDVVRTAAFTVAAGAHEEGR
ncbi:hypothetical protein E4P39_12485 [Blastococcus sp. CT_GayMR19]|uniref:hypothetical protein n=1 Tax=Blastococcus sp. CT_GayMR19 TaxID=2559608 RepID=UPI001073AC7A|nr:hypothetical protein [Blastococcus sp. CT_GayMR19]TFV74310.1 hypothetical protein E4P39_12485 [Blastococcus sp. CT_GayMR19]